MTEYPESADYGFKMGERSAYITMLRTILRDMGEDGIQGRWALERQETIQQLRTLCHEVGDNEWSNSSYLPDVIEKHLAKYLL